MTQAARRRFRIPRLKKPRFEGISPRASHWLLILPSLAAAVFALAFVVFLAQNVYSERERSAAQLEQDLLWLKQALRIQIASDERELETLAATLGSQGIGSADFIGRSLSLLQNNPEIIGLEYVDETNQTRWRGPPSIIPWLPKVSLPDIEAARKVTAEHDKTVRTDLIIDSHGNALLAIITPVKLVYGGRHDMIAWISLRTLLRQRSPWWISQRYEISLLDAEGQAIATRYDRRQEHLGYSRSVALELPPTQLSLSVAPYPEARGWQSALTMTLTTLAMLMIFSTWALRQHVRGRQKAEGQLRKETAMRQAIENSLVTGILAMDGNGRVLYANRAFSEMIGWTPEELINQAAPKSYWPPEDIARCQSVQDAILSGQFDSNGFQIKLMRSNGERFDVRIYVAPLVDDEGQHAGWVSSVYDITELQHEREALQAAHERFITVLNGLDSAVSVSNSQTGELLLSNAHFDRSFGLPDKRSTCCVAPFFPRRDGPPVDAEWFDAYRNRWYHIQSRRSIWIDGSVVWLDTAVNITARKDAAEHERQHNDQMQQTARLVSMGEMASSLAHELNQPLAAINSYASGCRNLLSQTQPNLRQLDQAITKMSEQAKRAGHIIRGIREFVQRQAPHRQRCRIEDLLNTAQSLLKSELQKNRVKLSLELEPQLPALYADGVMLEQVIFNLMRNAIEAMHSMPVDKRSLHVRLARDDEQLRVVIADRGTGIAPEQLEQLFKPFYTTKTTGMGMGLNICRSIIEHHQGRMWVEPNPGGGCRFIFTVPFSEEPQAHEP